MKTIGKILLFIGGLVFFVAAILSIVGLVMETVKTPATYFGSASGVTAFVIAVLWILLDLFCGYSGMVYAVSGKNVGLVRLMVVVIIVLFVLGVAATLYLEIKNKYFAWKDWSGLVYGGTAGILYVLGYLLDRKRQ
jgi:hypothetical protein